MIESWALFLPTLLDPSLSIFGSKLNSNQFNNTGSTFLPSTNHLQVSTSGVVTKQFIVTGTSTNAVAIVTSTGTETVKPNSKPPPIPPPPLRPPSVPPRSSNLGNLPKPQKDLVNNQSNESEQLDLVSNQKNCNNLLNGGENSDNSIETVSSSTISALGITNNSGSDQQSSSYTNSLYLSNISEDKCGGIHQVSYF